MSRIDASGRITEKSVISALNWHADDRLIITAKPGLAVIRASPDGLYALHPKGCIALPSRVRTQCGVHAGNQVLLVAAPEHGVLVVHTLISLDAMVIRHHDALKDNKL